MNKELTKITKEWMELERKTLEQRKKAEEFYDQNLMKLIEEDFIERNKDMVFEKVKYLIVSVGISYEEFQNAMKLFYKYRGELISGGLCFKEFVDLKTYGDKTNEYRVFYIGNQVATISRNSLQPSYTPEPPLGMVNKYKDLPSIFFTLDFAELNDGSWKILEAGDGSVSGPSEGQNLEAFYRAIYQCLN